MRKTLALLFVTTFVSSGSIAMADNDCCFDWAGTTDKNPSPNGWAQCTPTTKATCFDRNGIQAYLVDYSCEVGSLSPNGESPDPGNGFGCVAKPAGVDPEYLTRKARETVPSGLETITLETDVPTVSQWGLAVMLLLVLAAGTVSILRKKGAMTA